LESDKKEQKRLGSNGARRKSQAQNRTLLPLLRRGEARKLAKTRTKKENVVGVRYRPEEESCLRAGHPGERKERNREEDENREKKRQGGKRRRVRQKGLGPVLQLQASPEEWADWIEGETDCSKKGVGVGKANIAGWF